MRKAKKILLHLILIAVLLISLSGCFVADESDENVYNDALDVEYTNQNTENDPKAFADKRIEEEHPELTELLDMTAGEIKEKYGEMKFEYSKFGPGAPYFSLEKFPGVNVGFSFNYTQEELSDDMIPSDVDVKENFGKQILGLEIGERLEDLQENIIWDDVIYVLSEGAFWVEMRLGDYVLDIHLHHEDFGALNTPREDVATVEQWEAWKENFRKNATGTISYFGIKKYKETTYSCEEPDLQKPLVPADLKSSCCTIGNYYPALDTALFSAAPLGEESVVYIFDKGLVYYVRNTQSEGSYYRCDLNLPDCYKGGIVYASAGAGSGEITFIVEAESCIDKAYFEYVFLFEKDSWIGSILTPVHVSRLSEKPSFIE